MSTTDWVMTAGLLPLGLAIGWIQTFRVWRRGADVSAGISWATGEASIAGYHAFLLPATLAFTLFGLGIVLDEAVGTDRSPTIDTLVDWLLGLGLLALLLAFWLWLFAWPRFLVPPHLRGQPGWVAASWRMRRADRAQTSRRRAKPGREGGEHARR